MTGRLADFNGAALYVHAMVIVAFLHHQSLWHSACQLLFQRAIDPARPVRLVTATLTLDEAVFALLQEKLLEPPYGVTRSRSQYLSQHPEVVRQLMRGIREPLGAVAELLALEPVLPSDVAAMSQTMATLGLLPRDALHLAVMSRLGLTDIASDDVAFDRCHGITRFAP